VQDGMVVKAINKGKVKMNNIETTGTESLVAEKIAELKGLPTKAALMEQLTTEVLEVTFLKINGDKRVMTCTLKEDIKPKAIKTDPMSQKAIRTISDKVCSVWDINAKGWRSFRYDNVQEIRLVDYEASRDI
tara:strand:- start:182 stop:577 length:396 start_codon:yes stop_codon:yes gene_type:complete